MKRLLHTTLLITLLLHFCLACSAAPKKKHAGLPDTTSKGYWIIGQTDQNKQQVTVYYYNKENHLVKKETRSKRNADITRKKVVRSLKRALTEAVAWAEPI